MIVGAQLYTIRESMQTVPDMVKALGRVSEIGYTAVQLSGHGPVDPGELAGIVRDSGLSVAATHIGWGRYLEDLDAVIAEHRLLECRHPAIGGLPSEYHCGEGVKRFLDELAPVAQALRAEGMDFSYHNHNHEFVRYGDRTWLAALYEDSDPAVLKAELDTYWIQAAGGDPAAWIRKCAGREPILHIKDMRMVPGPEQRYAEIGEGNLNWPAILAAAAESGVEYMLVEQDVCYERDPFESLAISYNNLNAMGYC